MKRENLNLNRNINKIKIFFLVCILLTSQSVYAHDDTFLQQQVWSLQNRVNDLEWERNQERFSNLLNVYMYFKLEEHNKLMNKVKTDPYFREAWLHSHQDTYHSSRCQKYVKLKKFLGTYDSGCKVSYDYLKQYAPQLLDKPLSQKQIEEAFDRQVAAKKGPYYDILLKMNKILDENNCRKYYGKDGELIVKKSSIPKVCSPKFLDKKFEEVAKLY